MAIRPLFCPGKDAPVEHRPGCECSLRTKARLELIGLPENYTCDAKTRFLVHLPKPPHALAEQRYFVHTQCVCSNINALVHRVGSCVPQPAVYEMMKLKCRAKALAEAIGWHETLPLEEVVKRFVGKKRVRYQNALEQYRLRGLWRKDGNVREFVKQEAILFNPNKINPSCRAIQWRDPVYTLLLISLIRKTEEALYFCRGGKGFPATRFIAKNMTPKQRALSLRAKFDAMPGVKVLELDASRFDAHCTKKILEVEHSFWLSCNPSGLLRRLLSLQIRNRGSFVTNSHRVKYTVEGGRMSGDGNTAGGNNVIMACLLSQFGLDHFEKFDFLCDGDDSVFFYKGDDITDEAVKTYFQRFGFTMKIENRPDRFEEIGFCQCKPVKVAGEWLMVRDPSKVMSRTTVNLKYVQKGRRRSLMKTIGLGELSIYAGVPILDVYYKRLIASAEYESKKVVKLDEDYIRSDYRLARDVPRDWIRQRNIPITPEARETFSLAYGISVTEQLEVEDVLRGWRCAPESPDVLGEGVTLNHRWAFDWCQPEMDAY